MTKKTVAKKPTARKTATKKATAPARKVTAVSNRFSKTEIISELATNTEMTRKQVNSVLDELAVLIERHVKKRSVGEFALAGLIKIHTVKRPAKKAFKGINPFTGKETTFKARPASVAVKVHALKGLKDMAQ
ncbi:MAG: HU family DNA-binding protein [Porticoccaceae bacterium]|nr:HU family DNA-binding protein [Porticoccaceae bacterium]